MYLKFLINLHIHQNRIKHTEKFCEYADGYVVLADDKLCVLASPPCPEQVRLFKGADTPCAFSAALTEVGSFTFSMIILLPSTYKSYCFQPQIFSLICLEISQKNLGRV